MRWGVEGMCALGVLRGCVRRGVEGDVCAGVLRGMCVLEVLRGCTGGVEVDVCAGGVEGDVCTGVLRGMCALGC